MTVTVAADVPTEVTYGEITGYFVQFLADMSDVGNVPDELTLNGKVTLNPAVGIVRYPTTVPPRTAVVSRIVCPVTNGVLTGPDGGRVFVIATDQPAGLPTLVQWSAEFAFEGVTRQPSPITFNVPADGVVDLTTVVPAPPEPPAIVVVSTETAEAAAASAADAALSADDADASAAAAASDAAAATGAASTATGAAGTATGAASAASASATTAGTHATNAGAAASAAAASATDAATYAAQVIAPVGASQDWTGAVALSAAQTRATYLVRRLIGNTTVTLAAGDPGKAYACTLDVTQDAVGGRTLVVLGALTSYAIPYTPTTTPGARDVLHLLWNGTTWLLLPAAASLALPAGS